MPANAVQTNALGEQVSRIVQSEEFRNSETLRRLLLYLSEKASMGEADHLKEYTVAIEGLGKPTTYDPQHNSAVRIQVGRLRQKLADYYRGEGKQDPIVVELPKGRFRLLWEERESPDFAPPQVPAGFSPQELDNLLGRRKRPLLLPLAGICLALLTICAALLFRLLHPSEAQVQESQGWTPALADLWSPMLDSKHPLIVSIEDPLFVELRSNPGAYFRDRSLNKWEDVAHSPIVHGLTKSLNNNDIEPSRYYTAFGEVEASFMLGRLLGRRAPMFSIAKTSQLSWQQLADNNVVFIGVENLFFDQTKGLPIEPKLIPVVDGIQNPHPAPGEPPFFADEYSTAPTEQGIAYALITHLPGPLGTNDVESFTSNRSAGYVGAVQWFTDPTFAAVLTSKLKIIGNGHMPRYYQIVLRVRFKDDVPTETTFVLSRKLG
jgi:hypothetical protein